MSSIDERIVSMQFDNQSFEKNVNTSLQSLEKLNASVNGLNGLDTAKLANNIDDISNRFNALGIIGMTALQNITNKVVDAGIKMAKSLSVDQISEGFAKYTENTKNVKALLNSTGESIDVVSEKLDALSWYSDATSYSYNAMTSALKKFSAQDISMDKAIPAIMGIGNSLSYAGLAAEESSYAFDLYSKAMGQGYMSAIQWKSLNNMGAATAELKRQFMEAAVAAGTLTKVEDGLYRTNQGLNVSVAEFDSTLSHQKGKWLTNAVMMDVFGNAYGTYTQKLQAFMAQEENANLTVDQAAKKMAQLNGETDEFGKKAFEAAQQARTFSEAVGAVKDAASSAWRGIFENVFGNAEEATEMWTSFSDWLYGVFMGPTELLYKATVEWKRLGGRESMLEGFRNLAEALNAVTAPIKRAFNAIFGVMSGSSLGGTLKSLSDRFAEFTSKLIISDETAGKLVKIFSGLFSVVSILKDAIGNLVDGFKNMLGIAGPLGPKILDLAVKFSGFLNQLRIFTQEKGGLFAGFGEFGKQLSETISKVKPLETIINSLKNAFGFLIDKAKELGAQLLSTFNPLKAENLNLDNLLKFIGAISGLAFVKIGVFDQLKNLSSLVSDISGILEPFVNGVKAFTVQMSPITPLLKEIASAILILAGALFLISSIDSDRLASGLAGLGAAMAMFSKLASSFTITAGNMGKGFSSLTTAFGAGKLSSSMIKMSAAILIIAVAMKSLSGLNFEQLITGIGGVGATMVELSLFAQSMDGVSIKPSVGTAMILIAAALALMSKAIEMLGAIQIDILKQGLISIAAILVEIGLFSRLVDSAGMIQTSLAMVILAGALSLLTAPIQQLGSMPLNVLAQGLIAMGLALAGMGVALTIIQSNIGTAASIAILSLGLIGLAQAFSIFAEVPFEGIKNGLVALLPTLGAAFVLFKFLNPATTLAVSAALVVFSAALNLLIPVFYALGNLKLSQLAMALGAIGGALAIFGIMATVLQAVIVPMLGLAAAMALFGVGVAAFSAGVATLAAGGVVAAASFIGALQIILTAIPTLGTSIMNAVGALLKAFCGAILASIPLLLDTAWTALQSILEFVLLKMPLFLSLGMSIVITFINGIRDKLPELIEAAVALVVTLINSLADSIDKHSDELVNGVEKLLLALANLIFGGLAKIATDIFTKGAEIVLKFIGGIKKKWGEVKQTITEFKDMIIEKLKALPGEALEVGKNLIEGLKNGLNEKLGGLIGTVSSIGSSVIGGFKSIFGINSPSLEMMDMGGYLMSGLSIGIDENAYLPYNTAELASQLVLDGFGEDDCMEYMYNFGQSLDNEFADGIEDNSGVSQEAAKQSAIDTITALEDTVAELEVDAELNPTISPVVDMENFDASIAQMKLDIADVKSSMEGPYYNSQEAAANLSAGKTAMGETPYSAQNTIGRDSRHSHVVTGKFANQTMDLFDAAMHGFLSSENKKVWDEVASSEEKATWNVVNNIVQNITSPEALSETDIYRHTDNALSLTVSNAVTSGAPS